MTALGVGHNRPKKSETFADVEPSLREHARERPDGVTACTMREVDRLRERDERAGRLIEAVRTLLDTLDTVPLVASDVDRYTVACITSRRALRALLAEIDEVRLDTARRAIKALTADERRVLWAEIDEVRREARPVT